MDAISFAKTIKQKYPQYNNIDDMELAKRVVEKYPVYKEQVTFEQPVKLGGKILQALDKPSEMSKRGLGLIAKAMPEAGQTRSATLNFLKGTPKVIAETLAESAPGFISKEAILTAGTLKGAKIAKPAIKFVGKGIAKAAESVSGLEYKTPGVLTAAAKDAKLILKQGTDKAGKLFEKFFDKGRIRKDFSGPLTNKDVVGKAVDIHNKVLEGVKGIEPLTAEESLLARRSLDLIKKEISPFNYKQTRDIFDTVAKTKSSEADIAYQNAVKADALRNLFPTNKTGGTSIAKMFLGSLAPQVGVLMSPAVQGVTATGLGIAGRLGGALANKPVAVGTTLGAIVKKKKEKK